MSATAERASRTSEVDVLVSEVGPRDGLQSVDRTMPTAVKHRWVAALAAAGLREIEVASFVSPKRLPQMADAAAVVGEALRIPDLTVLALVPNLVGARNAVAAGARSLTMPVSVSESHSRANIGMGSEQAIEQVGRVVALKDKVPGLQVDVGLSTAFGCTIEGPVAEDRVIALAVAAAEMGADSVGLSDTTGYADPAQVRRLFTRLSAELGGHAGAAHLHNTRGQGLANVVAALDAGVRTFDSSQGGLGGCPYAPGASGNVVTEDLVFLLESMGLRTGVDIEALVAARAVVVEGLPGEPLYGHVPDAGLTKGFRYAGAGAAA
ncbi:Hydroxymethylglutaryl-CoA lyase [Pseudonocardia sp. Ae406_Ps2]|uniref:hydroxymethylglutaryl-CoA lyase n=1 Tax=unclassified Pseudonocardia TaxID=2619320 RepID=UPI0002D63E01|nr:MULTISPECIES: hydroxymethylglutaryl-CoA lyase [unclassified Pseudonocardia]OLL96371.1 Hydroxymethylglutaryl-CoA lyase [Pseudonocardia sp. Ae331_Ps2]OLM05919.1 Hydroxymethylglutaryl-CoA lyase [Pseudonocardia sp. Ae406_Ps2]OLM13511.1 Hydroxymethylglutaryl-CoA lyase [Pseudonocardia sp. Ae505_Ps2]OLM27497.1 Hydroxymethylglutaryl-CoA lyase [Pseudonocardia sp. Ae706_Ps2]OLM30652.1 Hydroxymethylglutaryl-CoA lyase [Pseudonocardia sp. Ae717_Ps2]